MGMCSYAFRISHLDSTRAACPDLTQRTDLPQGRPGESGDRSGAAEGDYSGSGVSGPMTCCPHSDFYISEASVTRYCTVDLAEGETWKNEKPGGADK